MLLSTSGVGEGFCSSRWVELLGDLPHPGHTFHQYGVYQVDAGSDPHGHHQAGGQSHTGAQHPLGEGPHLHRQLVRQAVQSVLDSLEVRGGGSIHLEFPFQVFLKAFLPLQVIFSHDAPPPFLFLVLQRLPGSLPSVGEPLFHGPLADAQHGGDVFDRNVV